MHSWFLLLLLNGPLLGAAWHLNPAISKELRRSDQAAKASCVAALSSALLAGPALAAPPPTAILNDAIVEFTEAVYPIIAIQNAAFPVVTEQVGALVFNSVKPEKIAKSIDLGLDALLSIPPDKITAFNGVVEEAFSDLKIETCTKVPLPPQSLVANVKATEAWSLVDPAKIKAWDAAWGGTLRLLPKTDSYKVADRQISLICLPEPAKLDALALAQADLGRAIGADELRKFGEFVPGTLKAGIRPTDAIPIAVTAKELAKVSPEQNIRLNAARKAVEKAAEAQAKQAKTDAILARAAANRELCGKSVCVPGATN